MEVFDFKEGNTPVIISIPHSGTLLPYNIATKITNRGLALTDTDYFVKRLYNFATKMGASILSANYSRYVVDLNRCAQKDIIKNNYVTEVVPTLTFDNHKIYKEDMEPSLENKEARIEGYWKPYHAALAEKIKETKEKYGIAVVIDAHSIAQYIPLITEEEVANFSLGTNNGKSCSSELEDLVHGILAKHDKYTLVKNGLFKGGFITKNYGKPEENVHVYQLELSKDTYMATIPPCDFIKGRANKVRIPLKDMVQATIDWAIKNSNK
jgi:N-formylglutamate amidohydrolase